MQRTALRRRAVPQRQMVVETQPVPPPVGGWNARDPLSQMSPTDALRLDNWTPLDGDIELRPGTAQHATGVGTFVETEMTYASPTTTKLFAAAGTVIYDATSVGAATSSLTGMTNGRWEWVQFTIPSASYLACVNNSADGFRYYNGSGWSTASLTGGIDSTKLATIVTHMNRIWLAEDGSLDVWYLDLQSITGTCTKLETSSQFAKGGKVMAMASWTRDGGAGMDDVLAIISSNGEVLIYSGTDPTDVNTWSKVGLFSIPRPIGRRCAIKFGGDIAVLTIAGLIPMSEVLQRANSAQAAVAITDKISGAFATAAALYGNNFGWQLIEYPRRGLLIINVPVTERSVSHQYVMNTKTGAWCRWLSINAGCWGLKGDTLYIGRSDGTVRSFDDTYDDDGTAIDALSVQAYNAFNDPREKTASQFRPQLNKPESYKPLVDVLVDYDPEIPSYTAPLAAATGWIWDVTDWDDLTWGSDNQSTFSWLPIDGSGTAFAPVVVVSGDTAIRYNGGLIRYEVGF